jgi:ATP-dependent DNA ligase
VSSFKVVLEQNLEGMVAERKDSCYEEGLRTAVGLKSRT